MKTLELVSKILLLIAKSKKVEIDEAKVEELIEEGEEEGDDEVVAEEKNQLEMKLPVTGTSEESDKNVGKKIKRTAVAGLVTNPRGWEKKKRNGESSLSGVK